MSNTVWVVCKFRSRRRSVLSCGVYMYQGMRLWVEVYNPSKGVWGSSPRKFCENMPSFGGHFGIQLSIFDLFSLFTGNGWKFLWFDKKVDGASELNSWRYRRAALLPDNPEYMYVECLYCLKSFASYQLNEKSWIWNFRCSCNPLRNKMKLTDLLICFGFSFLFVAESSKT